MCKISEAFLWVDGMKKLLMMMALMMGSLSAHAQSASNASSKMLWDQLSSLYGVCGMISIMMVCVFIQGKLSKILRIGIYLFAAMNWVSCVGYSMFPLSDSGKPGEFQDIMHIYVVTVLVVLLSIVSLIVIIRVSTKTVFVSWY